MKAYTLDLRERVVKFIQAVGSKAEAQRHFDLGRSTIYRYLAAVKTNTLAPKTSWGSWRKLDPAKLHAHVKKHPDANAGGTPKSLCRQPSRGVDAPEPTGLHVKKNS